MTENSPVTVSRDLDSPKIDVLMSQTQATVTQKAFKEDKSFGLMDSIYDADREEKPWNQEEDQQMMPKKTWKTVETAEGAGKHISINMPAQKSSLLNRINTNNLNSLHTTNAKLDG